MFQTLGQPLRGTWSGPVLPNGWRVASGGLVIQPRKAAASTTGSFLLVNVPAGTVAVPGSALMTAQIPLPGLISNASGSQHAVITTGWVISLMGMQVGASAASLTIQ